MGNEEGDDLAEAETELREKLALRRLGERELLDLALEKLLRVGVELAVLLRGHIAEAAPGAGVVNAHAAAFRDAAVARVKHIDGVEPLERKDVPRDQVLADLLGVPEHGGVGDAAEVEAAVELAFLVGVETVLCGVDGFGGGDHVVGKEI